MEIIKMILKKIKSYNYLKENDVLFEIYHIYI